MTWRERLTIRILLLVARMLSPNDQIAQEIKHLANSVEMAAATYPGDVPDVAPEEWKR